MNHVFHSRCARLFTFFRICHFCTPNFIVAHVLWMWKRFVCVCAWLFPCSIPSQCRSHQSIRIRIWNPNFFSKRMRKWMLLSTAWIGNRLKSKIRSAPILHLMFAYLLFISNINWTVCFPFPFLFLFLLSQICMPLWWRWYQLPPLQPCNTNARRSVNNGTKSTASNVCRYQLRMLLPSIVHCIRRFTTDFIQSQMFGNIPENAILHSHIHSNGHIHAWIFKISTTSK